MDWDGFEWDDGNWPKCGKHGVSKSDIEAIFDREDTKVLFDAAHSTAEEDRYFAVAANVGGHAGLFVGFTMRRVEGANLVRPITARYMHRKEASRYAPFKS